MEEKKLSEEDKKLVCEASMIAVDCFKNGDYEMGVSILRLCKLAAGDAFDVSIGDPENGIPYKKIF